MANKFIICNGELIMGTVKYHSELIPKDALAAAGGGRWYVDRDRKALFLWGESHDFGQVHEMQLRAALPKSLMSPHLEGFEVRFSDVRSDEMPTPEESHFKKIWRVPAEEPMWTCANCPTEDIAENLVPHYDPSEDEGKGAEVLFCACCYHQIFVEPHEK